MLLLFQLILYGFFLIISAHHTDNKKNQYNIFFFLVLMFIPSIGWHQCIAIVSCLIWYNRQQKLFLSDSRLYAAAHIMAGNTCDASTSPWECLHHPLGSRDGAVHGLLHSTLQATGAATGSWPVPAQTYWTHAHETAFKARLFSKTFSLIPLPWDAPMCG